MKMEVRGILYASQVSVGEENNLRIRVYGTEASLEWHQENPNYLYVRFPDGPEQVYQTRKRTIYGGGCPAQLTDTLWTPRGTLLKHSQTSM